MDSPRYVAAIEISSSKVIGAVGKIYPDGKLDIIATEQESCVECVRFGIVQNVEETALRITRIVHRLEQHKDITPYKIQGVFIGLSGRSLRAIDANVEIRLPEETVIDQAIIASLRRRAEEKAIDSSLEVIDAVPRSFNIGKTRTKEPIGNLGSEITATYDLIVCRPQIKRNIERTGITKRLGISINGFLVTQLAAGALIPTESEKRLGCMMVDMGAETTSVSIYKEGHLQYFATLPMGSRNITRDITKLNLLEEAAEDIKVRSGNAMPSQGSTKLNIHGVDMAAISDIIVARSEEIMVNILEQIKYAGLNDSDLPGGIILIGGGTRLNNMDELIRETSKLPVRRGQLPTQYISFAGKTPSFEAMQVISVLYAGATHSDAECLVRQQTQELPATGEGNPDMPENTDSRREQRRDDRPRKQSRWGALVDRVSKILTPGSDEDDQSDLIE